jgi:peptidoglycan hydrolase-like protein with peptidoglycan-binding domain
MTHTEMNMELGTTILGAVIGGVVGAVTKKDITTYALWGGGIGLVATFAGMGRGGAHHHVGQLPQDFPDTGLPGQIVYSIDPRTDPGLDPVSRQNLYPTWLFAHWQRGDRKIIAQIQNMLGLPGDGVVGGGTSAAIMSFQRRHGLQTTGAMDVRTLQALTSG